MDDMSGLLTDEILQAARNAARAWSELCRKMESAPSDAEAPKPAANACDLCGGTGILRGTVSTECGMPITGDDGKPLKVSPPCPQCRRADARKQGIELEKPRQQKIGVLVAANNDDGLEIPECLRRTKGAP
jgi:hypothetical protein